MLHMPWMSQINLQLRSSAVKTLLFPPPTLSFAPMSTDSETQTSGRQKSLTIDSTTAAPSDEYPGFFKTTSGLKGDTDSDLFYDHDIIPAKHEHRTVVLCFDGTGKFLSSPAMRSPKC